MALAWGELLLYHRDGWRGGHWMFRNKARRGRIEARVAVSISMAQHIKALSISFNELNNVSYQFTSSWRWKD